MSKEPVRSLIDGTVLSVWWHAHIKANHVIIKNDSVKTMNTNVVDVIVHPGDHVLRGDIIGYTDEEGGNRWRYELSDATTRRF